MVKSQTVCISHTKSLKENALIRLVSETFK